MKPRFSSASLVAACAILPACTPTWTRAAGAELTNPEVTVVSISRSNSQPVRSKIYFRVNMGQPIEAGMTDAAGMRTVEVPSCSKQVEFHAKPVTTLFSEDLGDWEPCAKTVRLALSPADATGAFAMIFKTGEPPAAVNGDNAMLWNAISQGDTAQAALLSNEIAARLRAEGKPTLANAYSAIAISAGADRLRSAGVTVPDKVLSFDRVQGKWVSTSDMKAALKDYQSKEGLKTTGRWDVTTFRSLAVPSRPNAP